MTALIEILKNETARQINEVSAADLATLYDWAINNEVSQRSIEMEQDGGDVMRCKVAYFGGALAGCSITATYEETQAAIEEIEAMWAELDDRADAMAGQLSGINHF